MFNTSSQQKGGWGSSTGFGGFGQPSTSSQQGSTTGGLFGNSGTKSGGLFGNSSSTPGTGGGVGGGIGSGIGGGTNSGGLFGNSGTANGSGLAGSTTSSGLFGTSNTNNTNTNNTNTNTTNTLNSNSTTNTNPTSHPYISSNIFQGINSDMDMPQSITEGLFTEKESSNKFPKLSSNPPSSSNGSLLSRLAKTFNFFKANNGNQPIESGNNVGGIFSTSKSNYPKRFDFQSQKLVSNNNNRNRISKPSTGVRSMEVKKLTIKSRPLKYHLIDADKVFNSKRRRVVSEVIPLEKLLHDSDDEKSDDDDIEDRINPPQNLEPVNNQPVPEEKPYSPPQDMEYWSLPKAEQLDSLSVQELSHIEGFIVGCQGFGQISFDFPVDLTGIKMQADKQNIPLSKQLFGNVVSFGNRVVKVYDEDEDDKPPVGFGINVPATITLENIYPHKSENNSLPVLLSKLRNQPNEFITYNPVTNIWVFRVQHFSIWGLVDEDDDGSNNHNDTLNPSLNDSDYAIELKRQKISKDTRGLPGGWGNDGNESILQFKRNLIANEIDSQLIDSPSNKPSYDLNNNNNNNNNNSIIESNNDDMAIDIGIAPRRENFEYLKQLVSVLPTNVNFDDIVDEKVYEPEIKDPSVFDIIQPKPNVAISDDWLVQLKLSNDLNSSLALYVAEENKLIRDNKLDIEQVDKILFPNFGGMIESSKEETTPLGKTSDDIQDPQQKLQRQTDSLTIVSVLSYLLQVSPLQHDETDSYAIVKNQEFSFNDIGMAASGSQLQELLELCSSLFDIENTHFSNGNMVDSELDDYLNSVKQRQVFSDSLKKYNKEGITNQLAQASNSFEKIFYYLCSGNIKAGIMEAIDSGNNHLSVLLTLADSNHPDFKEAAKNQLTQWENSNIPKGIINIYKIFAGNFDEVLKDLPWSLVLTTKVFYEAAGKPLDDIISGVLDQVDIQNNPVVDILRFYCKYYKQGKQVAYDFLKSSSVHVLIKWIIARNLNCEMDDSITQVLGDYCSKLGLWKEAIFVYSHCQNRQDLKRFVESIVYDNITDIKNESKNIDEEPFLVNNLKVPYHIIYEAVADNMGQTKDHWKRCQALIAAKSWNKAHDCIINQLGPSVVISRDINNINHIKSLIQQIPIQGNIIPNWNKGAGIFVQYFDLIPYIDRGKIDQAIIPNISHILEHLPSMKLSDSFENQVVIKMVAKDVAELALLLDIPEKESKVLSLPFGENEEVYFSNKLRGDEK